MWWDEAWGDQYLGDYNMIIEMKSSLLVRLLVLSLILSLAYASENLNASVKPPFGSASHLPYQAHSFNDLGIAHHLLLKGVKYFKFDLSLADNSSCSKYSSWDGKNSCFSSIQFAEDICCLAMRGDAGSENNFYYHFNTSDEFARLFDEFFQEHGKSIDFLFVAIDFQFSFELANHLVQNFVHQLGELTLKHRNLHFAIANDFILSYDQLCRDDGTKQKQLLSGQSCTPTRKAISDSLIVLQSSSNHPSDPRDYKGRVRNFNIYFQEVDRLCRDGFPTWPNKFPQYPLIFWEPSNEDQIQSTLRKLLAPGCVRKHNRTVSGIAFASNIDPEMFEIYMKETNQRIPEEQFPWEFKSKKMWLENTTSVKLARITGIFSGSNSQERLVVAWQRKEGEKIKNYLSVFALDDQTDLVNNERTIELEWEVQELHSVEDQIFIVVKNSDEGTREYNATIISFNSKLEKIKSKTITSYIISYASASTIYYISRTSVANYFNLYILTTDLTNSTQYGVSNYLTKTQLESISSIYFRKGETLDNDIFLTFGSFEGRTWMIQYKYGNIHKEKTLTSGINANIIDKTDGNVLISLEGSYSHGGLLLNNNAENKCALHKKVASERLSRLPHLVNMVEGSFGDLMAFFNDESEEIVTACHPSLIFSKHLMGANVEIASVWDQVFISTKYLPLSSLDLMEALFSGGSNYEAGLRTKAGYLLTSLNGNRRFDADIANIQLNLEQN